jgi:nucleoside-diphosphate-sugar epimerase
MLCVASSTDVAEMKQKKIVITGAAGLVGQNLVLWLREQGYEQLVTFDKHVHNNATLARLNPGVAVHTVDLAERGVWESGFAGAACVVILQAQITGLFEEEFRRNNVVANQHILDACKKHRVPYIIQVSSSVLHSKADDFYVQTKTAQEQTAVHSGLRYTILRPTLMFGWFDPKHFGWLSRFMERVPVFPVPADGKFVRQPLYNRDFCRIIQYCIEHQPAGKSFDIVGAEDITYIDIIRLIREIKKLKTRIVCIPYHLFYVLLWVYALFDKHPPFTCSQLKALAVGDYFTGVDTRREFGIALTPVRDAMKETFTDVRYADVVIER